MTPNQVRSDIQNICDILTEKGISLFSPPVYFERNNTITRISWKQSSVTRSKPDMFATYEQFASILKDGSFTCVLIDGSLIRLSYSFNRNDLISHNLWYYPCPFKIPEEELLVEPILDLLELYAASGIDNWQLRGPIRIDFDSLNAEVLNHPSTHVHMQHQFSRIPVRKPLSPGRFFSFVFGNFYHDLTKKYPFLSEWPEDDFYQTILPEEERLIHFSWR